MDLVELVQYKKLLSDLDLQESRHAIEKLLQRIDNDLNTYDIDANNLKRSILERHKNIIRELDGIHQDISKFRSFLTEEIAVIEVPCLTDQSEKIYQEGLSDDVDYKLDRDYYKNLLGDAKNREFLLGRISTYVDWRYSALQLGPRLGDVTDYLISCDPLYLVDDYQSMFREVKKLWTSDYQRRLRYYTIDEQHANILHKLPLNQLGLVVAIDYFNFRPLRLIEKYLTNIFSILQPGGIAVFTYNNCDYPIGIDNFRNSYYTYTPGRLIKEACTRCGFEIIESFDMKKNLSWLELQKPGTRSSIKGGQTLGKIKHLTQHTGENK
jgi:SAM-dependent methyltransferase